jgi:hypothetical protein
LRACTRHAKQKSESFASDLRACKHHANQYLNHLPLACVPAHATQAKSDRPTLACVPANITQINIWIICLWTACLHMPHKQNLVRPALTCVPANITQINI